MIYDPVYVVISRDAKCIGVFWSEKIANIIANKFNAFVSKQEIIEYNPIPST
jgi:hypothetical protein